MNTPRHAVAVLANRSSGTQADALEALLAALGAEGLGVTVWQADQPSALPTLAREAVASGPATLLVHGGDGTVNTAANALAGSGIALAIAPRGTFNYVARCYGLPSEAEAIAALVARGLPQAIPAGSVNGRLFLNNCSFGLYTDVIEARERHKRQWGRYRAVAVASALVTALRSRSRLPLTLWDTEGLRHQGRASLFFAGVNPRQFADSGFAMAGEVAAGAMGFVVVDTISPGRIVSMLAGAAAGTVESLQHVTAFTGEALQASVRRRRRLKVVLDGEVLRLNGPFDFRYRPAALRLLMPTQTTPQIAPQTSPQTSR